MESWEDGILKAYRDAGGCADNQKIYDRIGKYVTLTSAHQRSTIYGGRPAYVHEVRSYIANLKQSGFLNQVGRGRYCLTSSGKARAG